MKRGAEFEAVSALGGLKLRLEKMNGPGPNISLVDVWLNQIAIMDALVVLLRAAVERPE